MNEINQHDHDLLVKVSTTQELMYKEMIAIRDGTKADISTLFTKVDLLEKVDITLKNDLRDVADKSQERFAISSSRLTALELSGKEGVERKESNKAYIMRKIFESSLPFVYLLLGGLIVWAVNNHIISSPTSSTTTTNSTNTTTK